VKSVIVLKRTGEPVNMQHGRDIWWDDFVKASRRSARRAHGLEDLLYLLYTSGSTGKPKGIIHTTGGYLTASRPPQVGLRHPRGRRLLVHGRRRLGHGHSYVVYGRSRTRHDRHVRGHARLPRQGPLLANHRKAWHHDLLHGADGHPHVHEVGEEYPRRCDLSSLRLLAASVSRSIPRRGSGTGRSSAAAAARGGHVWQTETGHILITPLPGVTVLKPGSARSRSRIDAAVLDERA